MRILSIFTVAEDDLPDSCAYCGQPLQSGDDVFDVYGDLYHVKCWEALSDLDTQDMLDGADFPEIDEE